MGLITDPRQVEIRGATVHTNISPARGGWAVTVLFVRRPTIPIEGATVDVELTDAHGLAIPLVDRPKGVLVEAGGSLSTTANAVFHFADSAPPREIVVRWAGEAARFCIVDQ
jgi:hypothetical protein